MPPCPCDEMILLGKIKRSDGITIVNVIWFNMVQWDFLKLHQIPFKGQATPSQVLQNPVASVAPS